MARNAMGAAFPTAWYDGSIMLVTTRSQDQQRKFEAFLWLRPFTDSVWLLILGSIVASGLVYFLLEVIDHHSDRGRLHNSPMENIYMAAISFTGHFELQPVRTTLLYGTLLLVLLAFNVGSCSKALLFLLPGTLRERMHPDSLLFLSPFGRS